MGRHGGGQSSRTRASWPVVAIGVLVVAAIGFGFWLWSIRSVTDPIDADPVDGYAVVVSSPSCTADTGATVIDLNLATPVRSSLSACGRRAGERIAVQYLAGHPDQARLAGTAVAHTNSAGRWLPIAIVAAGLLAVIGTLSLLIDRHRSRHAGRAAGAPGRLTVAQLRAAAEVGPDGAQPNTVPPATTVSTTMPGPDDTRIDGAGPDGTRADGAHIDEAGTDGAAALDVTTRITAGAMPGVGEAPLRPGDIAVDEDLFTHRTHSAD